MIATRERAIDRARRTRGTAWGSTARTTTGAQLAEEAQMDEVNAMARAGEGMGKAVGTGVRSARHGATRAGKVGVEVSRQAVVIAEQELASRGINTEDLQERIAQRVTGMSRRELAKRAKKARKQWEKRAAESRKQLAKNSEGYRKELAEKIDPARAKSKRRKWPWILLVLALGGAAAAAALSRRPEELPVAEAEHDKVPPREAGRPAASQDGQGTDRSLGSDAQ